MHMTPLSILIDDAKTFLKEAKRQFDNGTLSAEDYAEIETDTKDAIEDMGSSAA